MLCMYVCILFIYIYIHQLHFADDWRCDGYRWYQNGIKNIPRKNPVIKKTYFILKTPTGTSNNFKRHAYQLLNAAKPFVLIQYLGNHECAIQYPHKNVKSGSHPHIRTCTSVLEKIADVKEYPSTVYQREVANTDSPCSSQAVLKPRNIKQVQNVHYKAKQKMRLSHDALYNLHELAYDLDGFVAKVVTFPNLLVICGSKNITIEMEKVLSLTSPLPQLLCYDTTFQLGDFYLSPILFRHTLFKQAPIIPALFLIHERKFSAMHMELLNHLRDIVPALKKQSNQIPFVTDDEAGIIKAIDACLPGARRIQCWNHTFSAAKTWLKQHGAKFTEIPVYISHLQDLFHQPTIEDYNSKLSEYRCEWSKAFLDHYMENIHPRVLTSIGRWILEKLGVYNPYSGVTSNQAESFNALLKRLQNWREVPVDAIILSLYYLHAYYFNEIQRGLCGLGNYQLLEQFSIARLDPDNIITMSVYPPDQIVSKILEKREQKVSMQDMQIEDKLLKNEDDEEMEVQDVETTKPNESLDEQLEDIEEQQIKIEHQSISQSARARYIIYIICSCIQ